MEIKHAPNLLEAATAALDLFAIDSHGNIHIGTSDGAETDAKILAVRGMLQNAIAKAADRAPAPAGEQEDDAMTNHTPTKRKLHSGEAGYIAERMNPHVPGTKVVIYEAAEQGIDVYGMRFAIVCDAHSQIGGAMTIKIARVNMKQPGEFCTECRGLET